MPPYRLIHPTSNSRKLSALTDLEYRVWVQYLLSADDFGVMPRKALRLQADNKHLANRKAKELDRCMAALEKCGLVRSFEHQGDHFLYQHNWQDFQKVTWPARTMLPPIPADKLDECTPATRLLFTVHPGAKKAPKYDPSNSGGTPEVLQSTAEVAPANDRGTSATRETLTLIANPEAGSSEGVQGEGFDGQAAFMAFQAAYPQGRRKGGRLLMETYLRTATMAGGPHVLMSALVNHLASEQWSDPRLIPGMDTWLEKEYWRQLKEPKGQKPASESGGKHRPDWVQRARAVNS